MDLNERGQARDALFVGAAVVFGAAAVYAILTAILSPDSIDARDDAPLLILIAAGLVPLLGWWRDRARRSAAEEVERRERERLENELDAARGELGSAREREETLRRERERLESRLKESEKELGGNRLAVIVADTDEPAAEQLATEVAAELGGGLVVQTASASWRPEDTGDDVIARAQIGLGDRRITEQH